MRPDYLVRRTRLRSLVSLLPFAVLVGLAVLRPEHTVRLLVFGALYLAFAVVRARNESLLLAVDDGGISLGPVGSSVARVRVPWQSVQAVTLRGERVGVLLRPDAPRPSGLRGMVRDPRQPDAVDPQLVREVPGLDARELRAAVAARGGQLRTGAS